MNRTGRLVAFSDAVLAIVITIMVLELHAPERHSFRALAPLMPILAAYMLSFVYLAIHWSNHHRLLAASNALDATIM